MGLDLGHEAGAVFLLGRSADQLELLFHSHGGEDLGLLLDLFATFGDTRILGHPEEILVGEVRVVDK